MNAISGVCGGGDHGHVLTLEPLPQVKLRGSYQPPSYFSGSEGQKSSRHGEVNGVAALLLSCQLLASLNECAV